MLEEREGQTTVLSPSAQNQDLKTNVQLLHAEDANPRSRSTSLREGAALARLESPSQAPQRRTEESEPIPKPASPKKKPRKITVRTLREMKSSGEKITMLTAYDATFARLLDEAGIEMLLVGDSLGMVVQGAENTLSVTLEEMIYHTRCVARGTTRAMVVGDLPFMTYQISPAQALESAGRLVKEGGAHAVKLEGGEEVAPQIAAIVRAGIPVIGHLGLTPQSVHAMGGFVVQGRAPEQAEVLKRSALALQEAGVCAIVLEGIPAPLAQEITASLSVPTIGIGAGVGCDGQVLVIYDLLGMSPDFKPRFVKTYTDLFSGISEAVRSYRDEVKDEVFPQPEHSFY
ncbi:MAG: 3-methyl-2-oxobutanoate hydroxymethyltransferase [Myxococcales bacterium]|nr:3-methyl-2-oxobutanoate hydroxymethyltransferase [Myxococcales bacterium]MCB9641928.1 3-methyl-2-oxobutanoate hydroxymethyltransferase [Myxococcales bacterium]